MKTTTQSVRLISHSNSTDWHDPEANLVYMARVSSSRENKYEEPEKLIRYLIQNAHWSPFEHDYITVEVVTTRAIGRQLLRHRSFTFQEFSQRYQEADTVIFPELRKQAQNNRQSSEEVFDPMVQFPASQLLASTAVERALIVAFDHYEKLLEAGVSRETARAILPECTATTMYMTGSLRSWIHFLAIRDHSHAQKEIQQLAQGIRALIAPIYPHTLNAISNGYTN